MRLRYEFTTMDMGDEIAAVPVGENAGAFRGMLKLNESSAFILEQLKEDTTPEEVHRKLMEKYPESSMQETGEALADFLNQLIRERLLIDP